LTSRLDLSLANNVAAWTGLSDTNGRLRHRHIPHRRVTIRHHAAIHRRATIHHRAVIHRRGMTRHRKDLNREKTVFRRK
jgi:hypothetical protein